MFKHNCNNFSDSFAKFLLGKGIPGHIVNMPDAVMKSPMGRMLLPQLTQGVNSSRQNGSILGLQSSGQAPPARPQHVVNNVTDLPALLNLLEKASNSCAAVFFTSATCPPCKMLYPMYDQLAEELGDKCTLVKVDISRAREIAMQYGIRATPTIVTFLKGEEDSRWSGADPGKLRGNLQLLVQMAWPTHKHRNLRLPSFADDDVKPVMFAKVPPLEKLLAKMNDSANSPVVKSLKGFIEERNEKGAAQATLPDVPACAEFLKTSIASLQPEMLFPIVDLFRCAALDPRISGYLAEKEYHKIQDLLSHINHMADCPYPLRLVTLQLCCNLFSTPLFQDQILALDSLRSPLILLVSSSFLDDSHNQVRVAASTLMYNIAIADRKVRLGAGKPDAGLPEADQVELAASVVEAISQEEQSSGALRGMLSSLGHLFYCRDLGGELADYLSTVEAQSTIVGKKKTFKDEPIVAEVGDEFLGKGLKA